MVEDRIATPTHHQDDPDNCGYACAQMTYEALNAGMVQQDVIEKGAPPSANLFATDPDAMADILNDGVRPATYIPLALTNKKTMLARITWSISHHRRPAVMMAGEGRHWVVVSGYRATRVPTHAVDAGTGVTKVQVRDPYPDVPTLVGQGFFGSAAPPPHAPADGCPAGSLYDSSYSTGGWERFVATRCTWPHPVYQNRYVVVCPFEAALGEALAAPPPPPPPLPPLPPSPTTPSNPPWLPESQAMRAAADGWQGLADLRDPFWEAAMGALPVRAYPVRRLDANGGEDDDGYYLVALVAGTRAGVLVLVDPRSGEILGATLDRTRHFVDALGRAAVGAPTLVWRPCLEAPTPFFPLVPLEPLGRKGFRRTFDNREYPDLTNGETPQPGRRKRA